MTREQIEQHCLVLRDVLGNLFPSLDDPGREYYWQMLDELGKCALQSLSLESVREEALAQFGNWVLEELRGENIGNDLDGGAAQDKAEELGLLVRVHVTEPCGERCECAEYGDFPQMCLRRALQSPAGVAEGEAGDLSRYTCESRGEVPAPESPAKEQP